MTYTVAEISQELNISKVSIYNRLKKKEFKGLTTKRQGITYINEKGFNLIKVDINPPEEIVNDVKDKETYNTVNEEIATDTESLNIDKELFKLLKDQLNQNSIQMQTKDKQIEELNERMKQLIELNKNSQILLKDKPQQDILLLETHFQELDTKLQEVKENMIERKEQHQKGFFSKIFKK